MAPGSIMGAGALTSREREYRRVPRPGERPLRCRRQGRDVTAVLVVGVDIIEIRRIGQAVARWGKRFLHRIFTPQEVGYARSRAPQLAARFAAKEAVMKALGTGRRGVSWKEIEVVRARGQAPAVRLTGRALERARQMGLRRLSLSLSHSGEYAVAFVVGECDEGGDRGGYETTGAPG